MSETQLNVAFTTAGINKLLDAKDRGIKQVISHIALGSVAFSPSSTLQTLPGEKARYPIADAQAGDMLMRLGVRATTTTDFAVRSVGGYLDDGTLLFTYSTPDNNHMLTYLTSAVSGLDIRFLLRLDAIPSQSLTVNVSAAQSMIFSTEFVRFSQTIISELNRGLARDELIKSSLQKIESLQERIRKLEG
tara:strand:- start:1647 stop:2216 length:570 start_codon:yes stop_codon:yes gene_type:complete